MNRYRSGGKGGQFKKHRGRVRVEDALSYLDQVKKHYALDPEVYVQFLDIMKDFEYELIGTRGVVLRVGRLFVGRPALIMGFNTFLPKGFEVKVEGTIVSMKKPNGNYKIVSDHLPEMENENNKDGIWYQNDLEDPNE